ncbi:MAG: carboxymuconolactone decarboxylase family protein [bacterium]
MSFDDISQIFREQLRALPPDSGRQTRTLALFSAAVAVADEECLRAVLQYGQRHEMGRDSFYEIVLQSYLFLGFPRMLVAAEVLGAVFGNHPEPTMLTAYSAAEGDDWFERGVALCRQIYRHNYEPLKERVEALAPDVFRWMINEGYGKVLARPGLGPIDRELAIVACLIVDGRVRQLHSHLKGALNVGCAPELLRQVIADLDPIAPDLCRTARAIVAQEAIN